MREPGDTPDDFWSAWWAEDGWEPGETFDDPTDEQED